MILTSFQVFGGYQEGIDQHRDSLVSFIGCESGCYLRGCRASKNQETDFSVSVCGPCYLTWKCILPFVYDIINFSVSPTHIRQCCKFGLNHQMKVTGLRRTCPVLTYIFLRGFFPSCSTMLRVFGYFPSSELSLDILSGSVCSRKLLFILLQLRML